MQELLMSFIFMSSPTIFPCRRFFIFCSYYIPERSSSRANRPAHRLAIQDTDGDARVYEALKTTTNVDSRVWKYEVEAEGCKKPSE